MSTKSRQTGISAIGDISMRTHFCQFYETKQDLLDAVLPYFKAGLESNELCLWVISAPLTIEEASRALRHAVLDLDRALAEHSIELLTHDEWYLKGGTFDTRQIIDNLRNKLDWALDKGYAGVRLSGSTAWLQKSNPRDFRDFEEELGNLSANHRVPVIVLCTFPLAESGAIEALDAVHAHQSAVAERDAEWMVVKNPESKQDKEEIKELSEPLAAPDVERIKGLAVVNEELRSEIIEHKELEDELRKHAELQKKIFAHVPVMIKFIGEDGRIKLVNREWERTLGWTLEEIISQDLDIFAELYPDPKYRQQVLDFVAEATGKWADFKPRVKDGRIIDTSWTMVRLSDGTCIGIGMDNVERKRAEDAQHKQRVLAEALRDTAAALNSTLVFNEVLQHILENVERVVPHDTSVIMLVENGYLRVACHKGFEERGLAKWIEDFRIAVDQHHGFRQVAETSQHMVLSDVQADPNWVTEPELDWVHSYVTAPIRMKGETIGILNLQSSEPGFFTPLNTTGLQIFADQAAIALENARLLQEVQTSRKRLQALSRQLLVAQEVERRSLARELHDEIGQVLTAVGANLRALGLSPNRVTRTERLEESLNLVDHALKQVRDLALDLRPSLLDDFGLVPALEWFIDRQAQRSGFSAEFVAEPQDMRLSPNLETTCFRVAQVAITNVVRHADAKQVLVKLSQHESELELLIQDDGTGFDVQAALERASRGTTLGLLSMQERIWLARGTIKIESFPGQGTRIYARFPLE